MLELCFRDLDALAFHVSRQALASQLIVVTLCLLSHNLNLNFGKLSSSDLCFLGEFSNLLVFM